MGLLRIAAVAVVAVALMPSDANEQKRLYERAEQAVVWAATFCERNPESCERASSIAETMKRKAAFAGTMIYDLTTRHIALPDSITPLETPAPILSPVSMDGVISADRGTLTANDLLPPWSGRDPEDG